MTYKDTTFCRFYMRCNHGATCGRALTKEVIDDACLHQQAITLAKSPPECFASIGEFIPTQEKTRSGKDGK